LEPPTTGFQGPETGKVLAALNKSIYGMLAGRNESWYEQIKGGKSEGSRIRMIGMLITYEPFFPSSITKNGELIVQIVAILR